MFKGFSEKKLVTNYNFATHRNMYGEKQEQNVKLSLYV